MQSDLDAGSAYLPPSIRPGQQRSTHFAGAPESWAETFWLH